MCLFVKIVSSIYSGAKMNRRLGFFVPFTVATVGGKVISCKYYLDTCKFGYVSMYCLLLSAVSVCTVCFCRGIEELAL